MSAFILQQFKGQGLRIVQQDGEPWFVLADLCAALGLRAPHRVAARLDDDEKGSHSVTTPGGQQEMTVVNESGLYAVILRSDKPEVREFRKWVTGTVLPELRKTGQYAAPTPGINLGNLQQMADLIPQAIEARVQVAQAEILAEMDARFAAQPINGLQKGEIHSAVRRLAQMMGGKPHHYSKAWGALKDRYGVAQYGDLPSAKFDDAMRFVRDMASAYEGPQALLGALA